MTDGPAAKGYPLAALRQLKGAELDEKLALLATRTGEETERTRALEQAGTRHDQHLRETQRIEDDERARDGSRSAGELAGLGAWRTRRRTELQAHAGEVATATRALEAARLATARAREEVAAARAEKEALEKHRAKWEADALVVRERRAEAELEDVARGRGRRPE